MVASGRRMYDRFGMSQVAINVLDRRLSKPLAICVGAHLGGRQNRWTRRGPRCKGSKERELNHHRNWPGPLSLAVCSVQENAEFVVILSHLLIVLMHPVSKVNSMSACTLVYNKKSLCRRYGSASRRRLGPRMGKGTVSLYLHIRVITTCKLASD